MMDWRDEDVLPRFPWRVEITGQRYHTEGLGELWPAYGVSHRSEGRDVYVCYPVPFNVIISFLRELWWRLHYPPWRHTALVREQEKHDAWSRGYDAAEDDAWLRSALNRYRRTKEPVRRVQAVSAYRRGLQAIAKRTKIAHTPVFIVSPDLSHRELRLLAEAQPGSIIPVDYKKLEVLHAGPMLAFLRPACLSAWKYRLGVDAFLRVFS